jgi:hypothetical protein
MLMAGRPLRRLHSYSLVRTRRGHLSDEGAEVLFLVAILDAGRNALSFFMLLVVSLGLSVVKETLGSTMLRCQILAVAHFIFGG